MTLLHDRRTLRPAWWPSRRHARCTVERFLAAPLVLALGMALVVAAAGPVQARAARTPQSLAERFAPVVRLVRQSEDCGPGEPYRPSDVDAFLGNPDVALRGPWDGDNLIKIGPTGEDLARATADDYLDFPGNPLEPGCDYERWADAVTADSTPTTYARIVTEPGQDNRLALQYWFYYPFNDYNNKHESDWEMIQLVFAASDPDQALALDPIQVGFSQHEGVEVSDWDDAKLEILDGTHLVVHPAAGSHANYYESALYLGRSSQQGFGCDNTTAPTTDVRPAVKLIPSDPAAARQAYPWIVYPGHWGQKEQAFYNGPTGPMAKPDKWLTPISWQASAGRSHSYAVPAGGLFGTATTDFFCNAVSDGSNVVRILADNPAVVLLGLVLLAGLLIWLLSRTTWRPTTPLRVARRRAWGQIITAAGRMYRRRLGLFVVIGALMVPVSLLAAVLQSLIVGAPEVAGLPEGGEAGGFRVTVAAVLTYLLMGAGIVLVQAATARALVEIDAGRRTGVKDTYMLVLRRWASLLGAFVIASVVLTVLWLTVLLLPVALLLGVSFALFVPAATLERQSAIGSLRRSSALVWGGFWKVASLLVVSILVAAAVGPLLGTMLLLTTNAPFGLVNVVSGVTFALLMPFIALTITYAYFDAAVHTALTAGRPTAPRHCPRSSQSIDSRPERRSSSLHPPSPSDPRGC